MPGWIGSLVLPFFLVPCPCLSDYAPRLAVLDSRAACRSSTNDNDNDSSSNYYHQVQKRSPERETVEPEIEPTVLAPGKITGGCIFCSTF